MQEENNQTTKKCWYCKLDIPIDAKKCPHCHGDLRSLAGRHPLLITLLILFIGIPLLVGFISGINQGSSNTESGSQNQESTTKSSSLTPAEVEKETAAKKAADEAAAAKRVAETAAFNSSPAGQICLNHPTWKRNDCTNLANRKVWIGMKYDMLVYELGSPDHVNVSNYGYGSQYQYCYDGGGSPSCFYDENADGIIEAYN